MTAPTWLYTLLVTVHVTSAVLYIGSIIHDLISKRWTERLRQPAALAYMYRKFAFTDAKVTPWQVYTLLATGIALTWMAGYEALLQPWLWGSIVLFAISGLFFYVRLVPVQDALAEYTNEHIAVPAEQYDWAAYKRLVRPWNFWVEVVTVPSVIALLLMVAKPTI